jgi:hypothetical protein
VEREIGITFAKASVIIKKSGRVGERENKNKGAEVSPFGG